MIAVPSTVSADVQIDVVNGGIGLTGLTLIDRVVTQRSVRGRLGAVDGLIDLDAVNGGISLIGR